jgi:phage I-like protein
VYRSRVTSLSIAIAGDEPPSEFRIFAAGKNATTKGTFTFDEVSAKSVMAEYTAHGIDLALDYDHAMVGGLSLDPAQSGKAAGWFNLEVRNGELWAVNVRWTEPAAEALRRKEWRYMSPAFSADEKGHVTSLLNVAITNLPATRRLEPLMAANVMTLGGGMLDAATVKKALDAIAAGDAEAAMAILSEMIAGAASGEAPAEEPAGDTLAEEPAATAEEEDEEAATAIAASISWLHRETGKTTLSASIDEVKAWKSSHLKLESETQKLAQERATLEANERDNLVAELVQAGEPPATAWKDPLVATNRAKRKPAEPWASMPIDALRTRAKTLSAAKGGGKPAPGIKPPPSGGAAPAADGSRDIVLDNGRTVTLSAREIAMCTEMKIDPKDYAGRKPPKKDA